MAKRALRSPGAFLSPPFVACALMLGGAAAGLQPAVRALVRHYSKEPISLRRSFDEFDAAGLDSFRVVTEGAGFDTAVSDDVGTDDVLRIVVEKKGAATEGRRELDTLLFVTYYNDPRDTVPHTPEVCYRQAGATVNAITPVYLHVDGIDPTGPKRIKARLLDLEKAGLREVLVYVFCCNGRFYDDRLWVRMALGMPGDGYTYFSKIEVLTACPQGESFADAAERCKLLLREALPILTEHFPANDDLRRP